VLRDLHPLVESECLPLLLLQGCLHGPQLRPNSLPRLPLSQQFLLQALDDIKQLRILLLQRQDLLHQLRLLRRRGARSLPLACSHPARAARALRPLAPEPA
jgi:hypothetical protein